MQIHEKRKYFRIEILHVLYHLAHHIDWNIKKRTSWPKQKISDLPNPNFTLK